MAAAALSACAKNEQAGAGAGICYKTPIGPLRFDLAAPVGTPVYATGEGKVIFAGWQSGYGNLIKGQHELGTETRYGHLSKIKVKVGQKVSQGSLIGAMGNTGRSTGPHLHYEVRVNGRAVNPMTFIKAAQNVF